MKKFLKVLGIIILVLVIIAAIVVACNWKYVSAVIDGLRYDEADFGQKAVENTQETITSVNEKMSVELREPTAEEEAKIASGELSQTELLAQIIADAVGIPLPGADTVSGGENQPAGGDVEQGESAAGSGEGNTPAGSDIVQGEPASGSNEGAAANQGGTSSPSQSSTSAGSEPQQGSQAANQPSSSAQPQTSDQMIAVAVTELYQMQNEYAGSINAALAGIKSYYKEQKAAVGSTAAKSSAAAKLMSDIGALEDNCDAKVEAVLSKLTSDLQSIGADTGIVSTLREAYEKEKSVQRASYINKYSKYM